MASINIFFISQLLSNFWMVAIIFFVQFVHYPLFHYVEDESMPVFSQTHQYRISFLVMPAMVIEAISYMLLLKVMYYSLLFFLSGICLIGIWGSTLFLQVPCHQFLRERKEFAIIKKLNQTNYIRTILWTFKLIILLFLYVQI